MFPNKNSLTMSNQESGTWVNGTVQACVICKKVDIYSPENVANTTFLNEILIRALDGCTLKGNITFCRYCTRILINIKSQFDDFDFARDTVETSIRDLRAKVSDEDLIQVGTRSPDSTVLVKDKNNRSIASPSSNDVTTESESDNQKNNEEFESSVVNVNLDVSSKNIVLQDNSDPARETVEISIRGLEAVSDEDLIPVGTNSSDSAVLEDKNNISINSPASTDVITDSESETDTQNNDAEVESSVLNVNLDTSSQNIVLQYDFDYARTQLDTCSSDSAVPENKNIRSITSPSSNDDTTESEYENENQKNNVEVEVSNVNFDVSSKNIGLHDFDFARDTETYIRDLRAAVSNEDIIQIGTNSSDSAVLEDRNKSSIIDVDVSTESESENDNQKNNVEVEVSVPNVSLDVTSENIGLQDGFDFARDTTETSISDLGATVSEENLIQIGTRSSDDSTVLEGKNNISIDSPSSADVTTDSESKNDTQKNNVEVKSSLVNVNLDVSSENIGLQLQSSSKNVENLTGSPLNSSENVAPRKSVKRKRVSFGEVETLVWDDTPSNRRLVYSKINFPIITYANRRIKSRANQEINAKISGDGVQVDTSDKNPVVVAKKVTEIEPKITRQMKTRTSVAPDPVLSKPTCVVPKKGRANKKKKLSHTDDTEVSASPPKVAKILPKSNEKIAKKATIKHTPVVPSESSPSTSCPNEKKNNKINYESIVHVTKEEVQIRMSAIGQSIVKVASKSKKPIIVGQEYAPFMQVNKTHRPITYGVSSKLKKPSHPDSDLRKNTIISDSGKPSLESSVIISESNDLNILNKNLHSITDQSNEENAGEFASNDPNIPNKTLHSVTGQSIEEYADESKSNDPNIPNKNLSTVTGQSNEEDAGEFASNDPNKNLPTVTGQSNEENAGEIASNDSNIPNKTLHSVTDQSNDEYAEESESNDPNIPNKTLHSVTDQINEEDAEECESNDPNIPNKTLHPVTDQINEEDAEVKEPESSVCTTEYEKVAFQPDLSFFDF